MSRPATGPKANNVGDAASDSEPSQMEKALKLGSYFLSGCMAVNLSQFLGAPLYYVNPDWYNAWIAVTKQSFGLLTTTMTQYWAPTVVRVSGDKSVRGQLTRKSDDGLLCTFPRRMVMIANHQIYTDWLYLWWVAYCNGMHGHIYIVLKESLRQIPVIGWGMRMSQFIFLKRNWEQDKAGLSKHLQQLNKPSLPMWLLLFPEGTNLADSTRERSAKWAKKTGIQDLQHTLLPRSTGLRFCLQEMRTTLRYVYDCTIAYEGVPRGEFAQDIFTVKSAYMDGNPPKSVNMYWRRFALSAIPLDDPVAFEVWLRARWMEKDALIEAYYQHGRFPADRGAHKAQNGKLVRGAGHIETEIKSNYWYEFLQIFAPVGLLAMVLYMFYNALPKPYTDSLQRQRVLKKTEDLQKTQINLQKTQLLRQPSIDNAPSQDSLLAKAMMIYSDISKNPAIRNFLPLPDLTPSAVKSELKKHQPAVDSILTQKNALQDLRPKSTPARPAKPASQKPNATKTIQQKPAQKPTALSSSKVTAASLKAHNQSEKLAQKPPTKRAPPKLGPSKANSLASGVSGRDSSTKRSAPKLGPSKASQAQKLANTSKPTKV